MEKADSDGLRPSVDQPTGCGDDCCAINLDGDLPVRGGALGNRSLQGARDKWLGLRDEKVVEVVAKFARKLQHVAETFGRDQSDLGTSALDQGIRDQCGRVDAGLDVAEIYPLSLS